MHSRILANRYRLRHELGRGGRGVVYEARDTWLERDVAVKLINPDLLSEAEEERFRREAQAIARMDHPSIAAIYDLCKDHGAIFIVMPIIAGQTLRQLLRQGLLEPASALWIASRIARALEHSHAARLIHRDVKPENVMVSIEDGTPADVKVLDFGLATTIEDDRSESASVLAGTPYYLSPEQIAGNAADEASDIYALGVVLYESLVGERPFHGHGLQLLHRIATHEPVSPRERGATIDGELDELVLRCLAKDPRRRPRSARELAEALERLGQPGRAERRDLDNRPTETRPLADRLGDLLLIQSNYREADELFRRMWSEPNAIATNPRALADQLRRGTLLALRLGRYEEALERCRQGIATIGELDPARAGLLAALAGLVCCAMGDLPCATQWLERARTRLDQARTRQAGARKVLDLELALARAEGNVRFAQGLTQQALAAYDRAVELGEALDDRWELSIALYNAAEIRAATGDLAAACGYLDRALSLKVMLGDRWGLAYLHQLRGEIDLLQGNAHAAAQEAAKGLPLAVEAGDPRLEAQLRIVQGHALKVLGDHDAAQSELRRAYESAERIRAEPELVRARTLLGAGPPAERRSSVA